MKYALAVNRVTAHIDHNVGLILEYIRQARENGSGFILFPECAIIGLVNNDNPEHDLAWSLDERSDILHCISKCARQNEIYVSIGFLEQDQQSLYDSEVCFDTHGNILSKYRRITDGWHGHDADKNVYRQGTDIATFYIGQTKCCYLICGDLFDETLIEKVMQEKIDLLLFPFARTFSGGQISQQRWDADEMPGYLEQITKIGAITLMANYINDAPDTRNHFFGGAFVVDKSGQVLAQK